MARSRRRKVAKTETIFNPDEPAVLPYSQAWLFRIWVGLIMVLIGGFQSGFIEGIIGGLIEAEVTIPQYLVSAVVSFSFVVYLIISIWGTLLYTTKDKLNTHPETDQHTLILRILLFIGIGLVTIMDGSSLYTYMQLDGVIDSADDLINPIGLQIVEILSSVCNAIGIFFFARYLAGIITIIGQPRFAKSIVTASNIFLGLLILIVVVLVINLIMTLSQGTDGQPLMFMACCFIIFFLIAALAYFIYIIIAWFKILFAWKNYDKNTTALDRKHKKRAAALREIEAQETARTQINDEPIELEGEDEPIDLVDYDELEDKNETNQ